MCSTPSYDNSAQVAQQEAEAAEARRREEERRNRIDQGTQSIRDAFKGYDDSYFGRFRDSFVGANQPTLDDQQEQDRRTQFFNLARAGNLNSSSASRQNARLATALARQQGQLQTAADDAVAQRRSDVASAQGSLETQLRATEDADLAASQATAQARAIDRTPGPTTGSWLAPLVNTTGAAVSGYNTGFERGVDRFYADATQRLLAKQLFGGASQQIVK